jgi:hypothetical protein
MRNRQSTPVNTCPQTSCKLCWFGVAPPWHIPMGSTCMLSVFVPDCQHAALELKWLDSSGFICLDWLCCCCCRWGGCRVRHLTCGRSLLQQSKAQSPTRCTGGLLLPGDVWQRPIPADAAAAATAAAATSVVLQFSEQGMPCAGLCTGLSPCRWSST